jgi:hypothetical protein
MDAAAPGVARGLRAGLFGPRMATEPCHGSKKMPRSFVERGKTVSVAMPVHRVLLSLKLRVGL